jgi:O-antigen/teichoic acid export membrane protein
MLRGTGLTMSTVAASMLGQLITVPVFLSHWDAEIYGVWLIMLGAFSYVFVLSAAFYRYSYGEFLKVGRGALKEVRTIYRTSLLIAAAVSFAELVVVMALTSKLFIHWVFPGFDGRELVSSAAALLMLYSALNFMIMPLNSITANANTLHGHYPRVAAWALVNNVFCSALPAIAVLLGADFWTAGLVYVMAYTSSILLSCTDMVRLAGRTGLLRAAPIAWRTGVQNFLFSLALALQSFLEAFRQNGLRILLGAFLGPVAVTVFATTRTLANVLYQGLSSITSPVLPELMHYVLDHDQQRVEGTFAAVWLCLFVFLIPGILLLCLIGDKIMLFWTGGAFNFDPILFLMLLLVVATFAAIQPAIAILQGQNKVGWLVSASLLSAAAFGALSIALMPIFGLRGAGIALLGAEICGMAVMLKGAAQVLRRHALLFPWRSFGLVISNVVALGFWTLLAVLNNEVRLLFFTLSLGTNIFFGTLYWFTIPLSARIRIGRLLDTLIARTLRSVSFNLIN